VLIAPSLRLASPKNGNISNEIQEKSTAYKPLLITPRNTGATWRFAVCSETECSNASSIVPSLTRFFGVSGPTERWYTPRHQRIGAILIGSATAALAPLDFHGTARAGNHGSLFTRPAPGSEVFILTLRRSRDRAL